MDTSQVMGKFSCTGILMEGLLNQPDYPSENIKQGNHENTSQCQPNSQFSARQRPWCAHSFLLLMPINPFVAHPGPRQHCQELTTESISNNNRPTITLLSSICSPGVPLPCSRVWTTSSSLFSSSAGMQYLGWWKDKRHLVRPLWGSRAGVLAQCLALLLLAASAQHTAKPQA